MAYIFIDLAERHSAAVRLNPDGSIFGSAVNDSGKLTRPQTHLEMVEQAVSIQNWVFDGSLSELLDENVVKIVIEDVPPFMVNLKPAMRAQSFLVWALYLVTLNPLKVELHPAATWQRHFGYRKVKGRSSKGWAKVLCTELGYAPEGTTKEQTDLRDAYLGTRWLWERETK